MKVDFFKQKIRACQNCGKEGRKLTPWVGTGGVLDWVHGMYKMWCAECIEEAQEKYRHKELKRLVKSLKKQAKKDWGDKCKDFEISCSVCQIYMAIAILEDWVSLMNLKI